MSKKVQLTITQKLEIIDEIEQKHTDQAVLAKRYGVDRCTISRIHTNREKLKKLRSENCTSGKCRVREGRFENVDHALITWFVQKRNQGVPINLNQWKTT